MILYDIYLLKLGFPPSGSGL